uniref:Uncharacterized protein n=1 Tax=viral metagenome TaxID=1070528 RepID=A0A6C0LC50_9ZZZZ
MEDKQKEEKKPDNDINHYIKLKLYSIPYVNNKGYRIGNYHIEFDTKNSPLPFSSFDQVDHFLINLFKYAKEVPNKDKNLTTEQFNKKFFKHYKKDVVLFKPIKYKPKPKPQEETQGGRKTKNYRPKKRKSKSIKNRTRKNR